MLAIIPYQVDVPSNRQPIANYFLLALTVVTFGLGMQWESAEELFELDGWKPLGLIGYMWLNEKVGDFWDVVPVIGNLLFLWIFGNAVCTKVGNLSYVPIYIGLGIMAGIIHVLFAGNPGLGAGGAINGIVGMYLVWFPINSISCIYIIIVIIRQFSLDSIWIILSWLAFDTWVTLSVEKGITFYAHLGGLGAGMGLAILLLKTNLVKMEETEKSLLSILGRQGTEAWNDKSKSKDDAGELMSPVDMGKKPPEMAATMRPPPPPPPIRPRPPEVEKAVPGASEATKSSSDKADNGQIRFKCSCGKTIKAPRKQAGKSGRCPRCSAEVRIPEE